MRISSRAAKALEWVKSQELPNGGLAAWPGKGAYIEVTGYLIPTLIRYNQFTLVERCVNWLMSVQNQDGSFNGLDLGPTYFDTGAVLEGLTAYNNDFVKSPDSIVAEQMAKRWLEKQGRQQQAYNVRVLPFLGIKEIDWYIQPANRNHYLMYAYEGLFNMGNVEQVREGLKKLRLNPSTGLLDNHPNGGGGSDTCATIQAACLMVRCGMDAGEFVNASYNIQNPDGSVPHDRADNRKVLWPVKYFLDLEWYVQNGEQ